MRNKLLYFLSLCLLVSAVACNKAGKTGLLVPKDAAFVAHINMKSLSSKLSWEEIKQTSWYNKIKEEAKDTLAQRILNDPAASGIDIENDFVVFVKKQGVGGYTSFQGGIKDVAAFEAFIKSASHGEAEVRKSGDLSYASIKDNAVLTWNKSKFIFVGDTPMSGMNSMTRGNSGAAHRFTTDSLLVFAKQIYVLEGSQLLDGDPKFADLIKSEGDAHFWVNSESLTNGLTGGAMSMLRVNSLTKGNIATASLNFGNGQITIKGRQYYGEELTRVLDKFPPKNVSNDIVKRLPSGDVIAAMAFNYPSEGWVEIVKLVGADGIANMFLGEKGITLDDISKALKGEMAFALTDVHSKPETLEYDNGDGKKGSYTTNKSEPSFVFGLGIKDKPSFDKLFGVVNGELMKEGPPKGIVIKNEKDWLVISSSEENAGSFLAGNNKPAYADKLSGHAFGGYLNIQKLIATIKAETSRDSSAVAALDLSARTWQDGVAWGDYKNGTADFNIEVNFVDKTTNSLKQLNRYADQMTVLHESSRNRMHEEDMPADTSVTAPVK